MDVRESAYSSVTASMGRLTGPLNICSEKGITIRKLAERIAADYGRQDLLRFGARKKNVHEPHIVVGICK